MQVNEGGTLDLEESKLSLDVVGQMALSGVISALLGKEAPQLDLSLDLPSLDTRSLLGPLPLSLFAVALEPATVEEITGTLQAKLQVKGNYAKPEVNGSFELTGATYPVASIDRLSLSFATTLDTERRRLALEVSTSAQMKEVLVGPFYADFAGKPATVDATA